MEGPRTACFGPCEQLCILCLITGFNHSTYSHWKQDRQYLVSKVK